MSMQRSLRTKGIEVESRHQKRAMVIDFSGVDFALNAKANGAGTKTLVLKMPGET